MTDVDWSLLIGYSIEVAEDCLNEEGVTYEVRMTSASRSRRSAPEAGIRVIGVRTRDTRIELVCAYEDWS